MLNADPVTMEIGRDAGRIYIKAFEGCGFCHQIAPIGELRHLDGCEFMKRMAAVISDGQPAVEQDEHGEARWSRVTRRWSAKHA